MKEKKNSFLFDEIISIETVGEKQTYDFTIPDTNCFFANNVLCHNSGGIGESADVILLLSNTFRKTKQEADKGKFEIFVEQRYGDSGLIKSTTDLGTCTFADSLKDGGVYEAQTNYENFDFYKE